MTDYEKLRRFIALRTKEICRSKKSARAYLVKLGTHDKNGNLTPQYGGK